MKTQNSNKRGTFGYQPTNRPGSQSRSLCEGYQPNRSVKTSPPKTPPKKASK